MLRVPACSRIPDSDPLLYIDTSVPLRVLQDSFQEPPSPFWSSPHWRTWWLWLNTICYVFPPIPACSQLRPFVSLKFFPCHAACYFLHSTEYHFLFVWLGKYVSCHVLIFWIPHGMFSFSFCELKQYVSIDVCSHNSSGAPSDYPWIWPSVRPPLLLQLWFKLQCYLSPGWHGDANCRVRCLYRAGDYWIWKV